MKKITKILACLLASVFILAGCNNAEKPVQTSSVAPVSDKQTLVGQWEGKGNFASLSGRSEECTYVLSFFEDGSMEISSPSLYVYGVDVPTASIKDDTVDFTLACNNPLHTEDEIPISGRDHSRISFSLKIEETELKGKAKQGDWDLGITFKKISDEPRSYEETETLTVEQMTEDANVLFDILENKHPNIFYVQSEEDYNKRKTDLLEKIPTLDKKSFYYELKRLIASIGDGHTHLSLSNAMADNGMRLPLFVNYFSGKWHIAGVDEQYKQIFGKEVIAINDTPMDEVFKKVSELHAYENMAVARNWFGIQDAEILKYLGIMQGDEATLTVSGGEKVTVSAITTSDLKKVTMIRREKKPITTPQYDKNYFYQSIDDIFYIQYNACYEDDNYPVAQFGEEISAELSKKSYKKIVIDLRNNSGGNSGLINGFLPPILEAKEKGAKVYCLIGGPTFSAAFTNAFDLKKAGATLVGQPTGGNMQQFTEVVLFDLPNSRFWGQYSTRFEDYDSTAPYDSLYPDVQIDHTIDAYLNGIDEEIEYIKKQK